MKQSLALIALMSSLTACGPESTPVTPDEQPALVDCAGETVQCLELSDLGVQIALSGDRCFECVLTSSQQAPLAWTRVAPCASAFAEVE